MTCEDVWRRQRQEPWGRGIGVIMCPGPQGRHRPGLTQHGEQSPPRSHAARPARLRSPCPLRPWADTCLRLPFAERRLPVPPSADGASGGSWVPAASVCGHAASARHTLARFLLLAFSFAPTSSDIRVTRACCLVCSAVRRFPAPPRPGSALSSPMGRVLPGQCRLSPGPRSTGRRGSGRRRDACPCGCRPPPWGHGFLLATRLTRPPWAAGGRKAALPGPGRAPQSPP